MATLSGQASPFTSEGEMVGLGARRKINRQPQLPVDTTRNPETLTLSMDLGSISNPNQGLVNGECPTMKDFKRRERRHIYHDIVPLKIKMGKNPNAATPSDNKILPEHTLDLARNSKCNVSVKPIIPPKPKYILRDKRLRHVYQTIDSSTLENDVIPPPLPNKPTHFQRLNDGHGVIVPPPLPPRKANEAAIKQRHKLDHEYFENLRKSVDEDLLNIAEEGDLPVPVQPNNFIPSSHLQRHNYGAHSPPLNPPSASTEWDFPAQSPEASRRHSLPIYESITDTDSSSPPSVRPPLPALPTSNVHKCESGSTGSHCCSKEFSEVNLIENLLLLKSCGWYWGNMTWQEAEALLAEKEGEGVFLMRDSQNPLHLLTVTVRSTTNTIHHVRVEYSEGKFQLYEPGRTVSRSAAMCVRHPNIDQFIKLAIKHSISGSFLYFLKPKNMGEPPVQIRLLTPISRLSKVKSLKYLCRMVVRKRVVPDVVSSISVPPKIQQYLLAGPYYDPNENL